MKHVLLVLVLWTVYGTPVSAETPAAEEALRYTVAWPSGLDLGEARLDSVISKTQEGSGVEQEFRFSVDAAIPGFRVADRYRSRATADFCSLEFDKEIARGDKSGRETTTFHPGTRSATRETLGGGGKSDIPTPACARDVLTFLHFVREEIAHGRMPGPQTVFFGGPYEIRLEYAGRQVIAVGDERIEADRLNVTVKGKASDISFELFLAQDATRRPLLVRVPFPLGTFSMQLTQ